MASFIEIRYENAEMNLNVITCSFRNFCPYFVTTRVIVGVRVWISVLVRLGLGLKDITFVAVANLVL